MLLEMATKETKSATGESVEKMLGVSKPNEVFAVIKALVMQDKAELVRKMVSLNESGASVHELVTDLSEGMTDLALASVYPEGLFGSDTYVSMVKDILAYGTTELFQAIAGELVTLKGTMPRDMRGQDLTVKLLGILVSNKVSESSNCLLKTVELLKEEVKQLRSGAVVAVATPAEEIAEPEEESERLMHETDDFSDVNVKEIRENLEDSGIVNGQVVNAEKLDATPFIQKAKEDVAKLLGCSSVPEGFEAASAESEVPFVEEVKKETETSKEEVSPVFSIPEDDMFAFMMGGLDTPDFPIVSREEQPAVKEEPKVKVSRDLTAEYQILAALSDEDEAFKSAMMGCEVKSEEGCVVIRTPFPQTMLFVEAYLRAYQFRYPETNLEYIKVRTTDELIN